MVQSYVCVAMSYTNDSSIYEILGKCIDKTLVESVICSKILKEEYGYQRTNETMMQILSKYRENKIIPKDRIEQIISSLKEDILSDTFIREQSKFGQKYKSVGEKSIHSTICTFEKILKSFQNDSDECARFILYLNGFSKREKSFNDERMNLNSNRALKIYRDYPEAAFPYIKEQYSYVFEKMWKECTYEFSNIMGRYPGIGKEDSLILSEELMCATECFSNLDAYKSDFREVRNAIAHENYCYEKDKIIFTLSNKTTLEFDFKELMFLTLLMGYKCTIVDLTLPLITLCELILISDYLINSSIPSKNTK